MLGLLSPFSFVQDLLGPSAAAVGVDLGTETIRLAQVRPDPESPELVSAAARDVPPGATEAPAAYAEFCAEALKELWREGKFEGRKAVLGMPSSMVHLLHLRLPKLDPSAIQNALAFEAAGKLPFDPVAGILRHHVVGDVYTNDGPRQELICTAVRRDHVELLLNAAEKARLDVSGLVATPMALRDCFSRIYRRASDADTGFCFIDIGRCGTRVTIVRGGHLYFARNLPIGSSRFDEVVADVVGVQPAEAKLLRMQLIEQQVQQRSQADAQQLEPARKERGTNALHIPTEGATALPHAAVETKPRTLQSAADPEAYVMTMNRTPRVAAWGGTSGVTEMSVAQAIEPLLQHLAEELQRCRRYHEGTFPSVLVERLVFVGGEANNRPLCQALARRLGVAAQIGDAIGGLMPERATPGNLPELSAAGIDLQRQQPAWAVACGLSLGAPA